MDSDSDIRDVRTVIFMLMPMSHLHSDKIISAVCFMTSILARWTAIPTSEMSELSYS
jgi:hypothetical protein